MKPTGTFIFQIFIFSGVCHVKSLARQEFVFQEFDFQEFVFQEFVFQEFVFHEFVFQEFVMAPVLQT